ncbi:MAG: bifunctional diaminohydroxyphosphoribosylaminopyrimidine deaminase/5-amino-6-(5-phosphoribosylamino)uracil reductase RibD [Armatimonadetes bacterium]|nr:bifunctional diaminohydroxyphosphoribosylaminopyrimidine deaminase/5-amino-6-(5-phosphoribosylamino)uracil reductase RibD [Armatimonadota bacterium]
MDADSGQSGLGDAVFLARKPPGRGNGAAFRRGSGRRDAADDGGVRADDFRFLSHRQNPPNSDRSYAARSGRNRAPGNRTRPERSPTRPERENIVNQRRDDEKWMREALSWAWKGKGTTSPRPSVGAVLVRDGQIIGGGHTQRGDGTPHAEIMALRDAAQNGADAHGVTAYVTLEPCCHWATTPPCCDALIEAGITRVVVGVHDPNPLVAGRGIERMRAAGIEVTQGVLERECARAQDDFLHHIVHQTPFVTLKSALSLDGKIALKSGQSRWITNSQSRERAHLLRHHSDAVLVGIETVLSDDPSLGVRLEGNWKQPTRIVLDSRGRLPLNAKIWDGAPQLIVATSQAPAENIDRLREKGAMVLELQSEPHSSHVEWRHLLAELYALKIFSILMEGGAHVAGSAVAAGIVQKAAFFVAPMLIGEGKSALSGFEIGDLALAPRLLDVQIEQLGGDVLVEGYF